jgi:hypothetical protein
MIIIIKPTARSVPGQERDEQRSLEPEAST